jgi:hypothetical protein
MLALSSAAFAQTTPGAEVGADPAAGSSAASIAASDALAATSRSKRKPAKKMTRRQEPDPAGVSAVYSVHKAVAITC